MDLLIYKRSYNTVDYPMRLTRLSCRDPCTIHPHFERDDRPVNEIVRPARLRVLASFYHSLLRENPNRVPVPHFG